MVILNKLLQIKSYLFSWVCYTTYFRIMAILADGKRNYKDANDKRGGDESRIEGTQLSIR